MVMNVQPIPTLDDRVNQIRLETARIVNEEILPNETALWGWRLQEPPDPSKKKHAKDLREKIQEKVKQAGLWAPHLPEEYGGCGLGFLEHAYMNEVLAYSRGRGGAVWCGCAELGQSEDSGQVRHAGATDEAVAEAADRRHDAVWLFDDRTR